MRTMEKDNGEGKDEEEGGGGVECKPVCIRIPLSRDQKYCYACTKCMEPYLQ